MEGGADKRSVRDLSFNVGINLSFIFLGIWRQILRLFHFPFWFVKASTGKKTGTRRRFFPSSTLEMKCLKLTSSWEPPSSAWVGLEYNNVLLLWIISNNNLGIVSKLFLLLIHKKWTDTQRTFGIKYLKSRSLLLKLQIVMEIQSEIISTYHPISRWI